MHLVACLTVGKLKPPQGMKNECPRAGEIVPGWLSQHTSITKRVAITNSFLDVVRNVVADEDSLKWAASRVPTRPLALVR